MTHPDLQLKKNEDKRVKKGHLWIYSNEIDTVRTPLNQFSPGDLVNIISFDGSKLGTAYINPNTLICARLLTRKPNQILTKSFFSSRLHSALNLRQNCFAKPYYRLIYGESDGLPGLVIDRFGDVITVQITTAGMERCKDILISVLVEQFNPKAILLKNNNNQRELEGLSQENELVHGDRPTSVIIDENDARFSIDVFEGQKTGWFYDHRESRQRCAQLCKDKKVLDLFCYTGAWSIPAALSGALQVTSVDVSDLAIEQAKLNSEINNISEKITFQKSDVFDYLKGKRQENNKFDVIILDPPALIKRKKDFKAGYEAYRRLNQMALQILSPNGILISASCSFHLSPENLQEILRSTARHIDRHLTIFAIGGQGPDHPIHSAIPETQYLKTFFCSVTKSL